MKALRMRRSFSHQGKVKGASRGRSAGPAIPGGNARVPGFGTGHLPPSGGPMVPGNDAGYQLLEGMQGGIRPPPMVGASPAGGPWVRSGRKTRSYFGA